jgi:CHAT domain-containing protein
MSGWKMSSASLAVLLLTMPPGARALLVSHWSVDSEGTTRLTTSTFAIMKADPKLGRADALRSAVLAYINDKSNPLNAYSAFWASFSIIREGTAR